MSTIVTIFLSCTIVSIWTIFRFLSQPINFDLIGQQLLARHWLSGYTEGVLTAPTNYIFKIFVFYMPAEIFNLDPTLFLILSTLLINILTIIGIYYILYRILKKFSIDPGMYFNMMFLWISTIAGSVFWIQFSNSRNLEIVAGLGIIYLGIRCYEGKSLVSLIPFVIYLALVFFSDPMQIYVSGTILAAYIILDSLFLDRRNKKSAIKVLIVILIAFLLSLAIQLFARKFFGIVFFKVGSLNQSLDVLNNLSPAIKQTIRNILDIFSGTEEMGRWRRRLNNVFTLYLFAMTVWLYMKYKLYNHNRKLMVLIVLALVFPVAIYFASGQPLLPGTSRYLIMLFPGLIMLIATLEAVPKQSLIAIFTVVILVNSYGLIRSLAGVSNNRLEGIDVLERRYDYIVGSDFSYGYADMSTAIPAEYFFGRDSDKVIFPLDCRDNKLYKVNLFFDKGVFDKIEDRDKKTSIIVGKELIRGPLSDCGVEDIKNQLGEWSDIEELGDGDLALIYPSQVMTKLTF